MRLPPMARNKKHTWPQARLPSFVIRLQEEFSQLDPQYKRWSYMFRKRTRGKAIVD